MNTINIWKLQLEFVHKESDVLGIYESRELAKRDFLQRWQDVINPKIHLNPEWIDTVEDSCIPANGAILGISNVSQDLVYDITICKYYMYVEGKKMNLNEYQDKARTTAVYPDHVGLLYTVLGLAGEAGEIANKVKKIYRDDDGTLTHAKRADLIDELGDVLWYVAALAGELGTELEPVAKGNLEKLAARKARNAINGTGDKR